MFILNSYNHVDFWHKFCMSCEKSQKDELSWFSHKHVHADILSCFPFSTPQPWAVMIALKVIHWPVIVRFIIRLWWSEQNKMKVYGWIHSLYLDFCRPCNVLLPQMVTKCVSVNNLKFIFEVNWQRLCQQLWTT